MVDGMIHPGRDPFVPAEVGWRPLVGAGTALAGGQAERWVPASLQGAKGFFWPVPSLFAELDPRLLFGNPPGWQERAGFDFGWKLVANRRYRNARAVCRRSDLSRASLSSGHSGHGRRWWRHIPVYYAHYGA